MRAKHLRNGAHAFGLSPYRLLSCSLAATPTQPWSFINSISTSLLMLWTSSGSWV
ncbi:hypothetical protein CSPX01_10961 [Colletotrichum filicis]|nr:hypothetical protein CSPX01_10961 [Colletotrichum filicis]